MTRQVVIHHDDIGGSYSANMAFIELCRLGIVTSGSIIVPGSWFPHMAQLARDNPQLDVGVHLTLTAEFDRFRWRPLTGLADNGLCDAEGFFHRTGAATRGAHPAAVEREFRAQIDAALGSGVDVTHIDTHMGTAWAPEFIEIYERLGDEYKVPIFLPRSDSPWLIPSPQVERAVARAEGRGNPTFAAALSTPFGNLAPSKADYRAVLDGAVEGLTYGAFHFTAPGDIAMISDDAPTRLGEFELFRSGDAAALIAELKLELAGMRQFRDALRAR